MNHWVIAPVILPMLVAVALLLVERLWVQRAITAAGALLGAALVVWLANRSRFEGMESYFPGTILPPQGAVLVLDKLAALQLALVMVLHLVAVGRLLIRVPDRNGTTTLVQHQLLLSGLAGTVLAGDLVQLWLVWTLALVALAGLAPRCRRIIWASVAALTLAGVSAALIAGTGSLAGIALYLIDHQPMAGWIALPFGVAFGMPMLWLFGPTPEGRMAGLVAAGLVVRWLTLAQIGTVAGQTGVLVALWVLCGAGIWAIDRSWPMQRKALRFGLSLALILGGMQFGGGVIRHFGSIATQLRQPASYITAVLGLPDQPVLVPEPGL